MSQVNQYLTQVNQYLMLLQENTIFKSITFPPEQVESIRKGLQVRQPVFIRAGESIYRPGEIVETEWGDLLKVVSVKEETIELTYMMKNHLRNI
ncbi:hypothetical protein KAR91_16045 [Candidatus Pacearchaeota archaeon]|nr:hypothetical protein [Candidatus Pacearchaeota archaeon]